MAEDPYKYFRLEAREILDQLGQGALDLEKGPPAPDAVARLLRLAHTLKGAARVVKQPAIADHAHTLEGVLSPLQDPSLPLSRARIDQVFGLVDDIGKGVALLTPPPSSESSPAHPSEQTLPAFRPAKDDLDLLLDSVFEAQVRLGALRPRLAQVEQARRMASLVVSQLSRPGDSETSRASGPVANDKARSMATDLREVVSAIEHDLVSNIDRLDRELRQVREAAERLRLAPASSLFTFLERAVRDVAQALGKRVLFETTGGDVRVDPFVLSVMQSALLHAARNAVAHGIEAGDGARRTAGKPIEGRVAVRVVQRGTVVSFACSDDGRGVDLDAVRRSPPARQLALREGRELAPAELLRLLLKGGISTSGTVTEVSGRGIGLDVVREAADRLGGEAALRTDAGRGTTVEIVVPLSVASLHALTVEAAGGTVALPLDSVRGTLRVSPADIVRGEQHESVVFDGQAIPLASLTSALSAGRSSTLASGRGPAVVVRGRTGDVAFTVDRIVGPARVIARPLPDLTPAFGHVAGASLDDVGDPLLVLDPDQLVAGAGQAAAIPAVTISPRVPILVVDDSLTTRMLEQSILESAGYAVDVACSGEEALSKARATGYALFLVDVEMPGMDGFELIEQIRRDPALQHIPSVLVTSRDSQQDRQRGENAGAQAYIVKSEFDQGVLLEQIRSLVRR